MQVLSRKKQQSIVIEDDSPPECALRVTVLESRRGQVKLGLEVPAGTRILRREVRERINDMGGEAGSSNILAARFE